MLRSSDSPKGDSFRGGRYIGADDDGPWNLAAGRAREKHRRVVCGPSGTDRDSLADEFQQSHNMGGVPPGSIARPRG